MKVFGEDGVVSALFSHLDIFAWPALLLGVSIIVLYFLSLGGPAQQAILRALPQRRTLQRFTLTRNILGIFTRDDVVQEHRDGRIDLRSFRLEQVADNPVANRRFFARAVKRLTDITISLSLALFTLPLLLLVTVMIRAESVGPVIYRQQRVGRDGKVFQLYKFRSMSVDAESNGACWAGQNDARVTRVGRFIRKTRIDEIPQVLNILKGEMSFVGPRPERPEFIELLAEEIPHYNDRHLMKPGLTGWAQVNYPYGASVDDARMKLQYDLYYLKHFSFLLDLFIIIKTLKVAVLGIGSR